MNSTANGLILSTRIHSGSHPKYTKAIEIALDEMYKKAKSNPVLANLILQGYANRLMKGLQRTTKKLG